MRRLPARPTRDPIASFPRPSDGELVEVWATRHTMRSHDRHVDGTVYYRPLVAVSGAVVQHGADRHPSESAAVEAVLRIFTR